MSGRRRRGRKIGDESASSGGRARGQVGRNKTRASDAEREQRPAVDPRALDGWDEARAAFDACFEWRTG